MRTAYNLTDKTTPDMRACKRARAPKDLLVDGKVIKPGQSAEISDGFRLGDVASLLSTDALSVDQLPAWYQAAGRDPEVEVMPVMEATEEPKAEAEPEAEPEPEKKTKKKRKR